jgi:hypothetical protein
MALTRGGYPARDLALDVFPLRGRVVGAGAGAAPTVPSDKDNLVASSARSADGQYTATLRGAVFPWKTTQVPNVVVVSTGATPLRANVTGVNATTGVITYETRNASTGALAAAATTDTVYFKIDVRYSDA